MRVVKHGEYTMLESSLTYQGRASFAITGREEGGMETPSPMFESGSRRYSQACAVAERDRIGAVPLGLPSDGYPRPEAFSQLVHIKGVRVQRDLYPRANFNAALATAALNGLECYRFSRRSFVGIDQ